MADANDVKLSLEDLEKMTPEELAAIEKEIEAEEREKSVGGDYPKAPSQENIYKFFKYIISLKKERDKLIEESKVANLEGGELGNLPISVRRYMSISNYARVEGLDEVANYLDREAEIILATSSSKKGWLGSLFVTQIKKGQSMVGRVGGTQKKGFFNWGKSNEGGGE